MRVGWKLFTILGVFFVAVTLVYGFWSREWTGTTVLAFCIGLSIILGYYLFFTSRRLPPQPEDNTDAEVSDGAGELGFFSPHSGWPIAAAFGASVVVLGLIFGVWLAIIGVFLLLWASIGMLFEYYVIRRKDDSSAGPSGQERPALH